MSIKAPFCLMLNYDVRIYDREKRATFSVKCLGIGPMPVSDKGQSCLSHS